MLTVHLESNRLVRITHKMERAKKHILDLQDAFQVFLDSSPYEVIRDYKPDTGEFVYRVAKIEPTPPSIMLIAGDAIHNIRSVLDHLIGQLVEANGQIPSRSNGYPIFQNLNGYMAGKNRKIQGVSTIPANVIDVTNPYKGGNDDFWILHELDNIDK